MPVEPDGGEPHSTRTRVESRFERIPVRKLGSLCLITCALVGRGEAAGARARVAGMLRRTGLRCVLLWPALLAGLFWSWSRAFDIELVGHALTVSFAVSLALGALAGVPLIILEERLRLSLPRIRELGRMVIDRMDGGETAASR